MRSSSNLGVLFSYTVFSFNRATDITVFLLSQPQDSSPL